MKIKTTFPNFLRCSKPGRRKKLIASQTYLKKQEKNLKNQPNQPFNGIRKKEQTSSKSAEGLE